MMTCTKLPIVNLGKQENKNPPNVAKLQRNVQSAFLVTFKHLEILITYCSLLSPDTQITDRSRGINLTEKQLFISAVEPLEEQSETLLRTFDSFSCIDINEDCRCAILNSYLIQLQSYLCQLTDSGEGAADSQPLVAKLSVYTCTVHPAGIFTYYILAGQP